MCYVSRIGLTCILSSMNFVFRASAAESLDDGVFSSILKERQHMVLDKLRVRVWSWVRHSLSSIIIFCTCWSTMWEGWTLTYVLLSWPLHSPANAFSPLHECVELQRVSACQSGGFSLHYLHHNWQEVVSFKGVWQATHLIQDTAYGPETHTQSANTVHNGSDIINTSGYTCIG